MRGTERDVEFVRCHTWGHTWYETDGDYKPLFGYLFALRCDRCGAIRNDIYDVHGQLASRNYRYPDGYRWGKVARSELRVDLIKRRTKVKRRKSA